MRWWRRAAAKATRPKLSLSGHYKAAARARPRRWLRRAPATSWKKSRPSGATWPPCPPTTASCTGRRSKVYGWLLCQNLELAELRLALVYFDIGTPAGNAADASASRPRRCGSISKASAKSFLHWADRRNWRTAPRAMRRCRRWLFRTPRSAPASATWPKRFTGRPPASRCLMAQAPTGIGKTIGTVFPLLKAAPRQELDKVFFLAAKTLGPPPGAGCAGADQRQRPGAAPCA